MKGLFARLPKILFIFSLVFFSVIYGMVAFQAKLFPYYQLVDAGASMGAIAQMFSKTVMWYYIKTDETKTVETADLNAMSPGLTKVVAVGDNGNLTVKVMNGKGDIFQQWNISWFKVWPKAPSYLAPNEVPQSKPGTHIHGTAILPNGDLVFNFEHLSMVRMDPCGNVVWKLPFRTHHSLFVDDDGNLWASAQIDRDQPSKGLPFYGQYYVEPFILKVSPQGKILEQKSVLDLLKENHQEGALYSSTMFNFEPLMIGDAYKPSDTLHLNDVEVFSRKMAPGFFQPGDIMISLRNINTIMVFTPDWKLKYKTSYEFVRQHDPDFKDGNHISVFDNHNTLPDDEGQSRILVINALNGETSVPFTGTPKNPFFTGIMGTHQWLQNGDLLLAETLKGRAIEVTPGGNTVWDYHNIVEPGVAGVLEEATRLPAHFTPEFFAQARSQCKQPSPQS